MRYKIVIEHIADVMAFVTSHVATAIAMASSAFFLQLSAAMTKNATPLLQFKNLAQRHNCETNY